MARTDYENIEKFTEQLGIFSVYNTKAADEVPLKEVEHARFIPNTGYVLFNRIKAYFEDARRVGYSCSCALYCNP